MTPATVTRVRQPTPHRAAPPRGAVPPRPARRLSGPVGRVRPPAQPATAPTLGVRALELVRSLPDRSLIDRLVRGRAWIPVLGVLLAGLVAMQVEILKLGTRVGSSIERSTALQSQNELLQARVATLSDDQRIERLAAGMGMVMPAPGQVAFLYPQAGNAVGRALANIHAPDAAAFAGELAAAASASLQSAAAPAGASPAGSGAQTGAAAPSPSGAAAPTPPSATQPTSSAATPPAAQSTAPPSTVQSTPSTTQTTPASSAQTTATSGSQASPSAAGTPPASTSGGG